MTDIDTKQVRELLTEICNEAEDNGNAPSLMAEMRAPIDDALDERDRLKAENERLRKAIRDFLSGPHTDQSNRTAQRRADLWRALRAALEQGHD